MGENKGNNGIKRKRKRTRKTGRYTRTCTSITSTEEKTRPNWAEMCTPQQLALIEDKTKQKPYTPLPKFQISRMISQEALMALTLTVWGTSPEYFIPQSMQRDEHIINTAIKLEHFSAPAVYPVSGETI